MTDDPELERLRAEISAADQTLVETVNRRLDLVAELKRHKEANGIAFLDPDRERQLLADLVRTNGGPLSEQGVAELVSAVLDLTKRELGR
ncbi:MAG: chorismate mutase / prephenate dehydratase [Gaiellaceae bacterium]|jgi:chorismate mutase|nr:chorismate mutase / prephenate dehydratase [Gaiellaceae bacterium]